MREIRIVADDYGLHASVNRGIEALAEACCIHGVSIMAHRDADLSTLDALRASPVALGAHLVFVEERPRIPSRVWDSFGGRFPATYQELFYHVARSRALLDALAAEADAQLSALRERKVPLAFINSHQHTHLFPLIWRALVPLFAREKLTVRAAQRIHIGSVKQLLVEASSTCSTRLWPIQGCAYSTPIGIDAAGHFDARAATRWKHRLHKSRSYPLHTELVIHPGREDESLRSRYGHWRYGWEQEFHFFFNGTAHKLLGLECRHATREELS